MDEEYLNNEPYQFCPNCGRGYDELDCEFQFCSFCRYDADEEKEEKQ